MKREIKFKVFFYDGVDKSTGKFITAHEALNEDYIRFNTDGVLEPADGCSIIVSFTGLKDKNGVEIYEGDIAIIDGQTFKVEWNQNQTAYCISPICDIHHDDYLIQVLDYQQLGNGYLSRKDGEVVGNIHENPELLN